MSFVDEARIFVKAGDGGQGCISFHREKYWRHPRPDGGDGGRGGDVIFIADRSLKTLLDFRFKQHYKAQNGGHASSNNKKGRDGKTCYLRVPAGTIIKDYKTGLMIKDLIEDQQSVTVAKGGLGGLGNGSKRPILPLQTGEEITIGLELKLIADVGLIGFPNAGKSTIISSISKVRSKIANYPFTTKQPILGFVSKDDFLEGSDPEGSPYKDFVIADLPGIIEGAHQGRGLGDKFLKHAERTRILVQVIDMAGSEGRDPLEDFAIISNEIEQYSDMLLAKHRLVVANKMDVDQADANLKRFKKKYQQEVFAVSALDQQGLIELITRIRKILCQENSQDLSNESSSK